MEEARELAASSKYSNKKNIVHEAQYLKFHSRLGRCEPSSHSTFLGTTLPYVLCIMKLNLDNCFFKMTKIRLIFNLFSPSKQRLEAKAGLELGLS